MTNNIINSQNISLNFAEFDAKFQLKIPAVIPVPTIKFGRDRDTGKTPHPDTYQDCYQDVGDYCIELLRSILAYNNHAQFIKIRKVDKPNFKFHPDTVKYTSRVS